MKKRVVGCRCNTEWLAADVTPVGSPAKDERDILGMILDVVWPIQASFVVGEPLCDIEISPCSRITLPRGIY